MTSPLNDYPVLIFDGACGTNLQLIDVPEDVQLRVGSTCSVLVNTGDTDPAAVATGVNQ
jgi:hypothetical protein